MILPPEPNGKIHHLTVTVDESRSWIDALKAHGGYQHPTWDVWSLGNLYPPQVGTVPLEKKLLLVNFGRNIDNEDVVRWWQDQKLHPASPRACMAIAEKHPFLHRDMGVTSIEVVAPEIKPLAGQHIQVYFSGFIHRERAVFPRCISGVRRTAPGGYRYPDWYQYNWFAFYEPET